MHDAPARRKGGRRAAFAIELVEEPRVVVRIDNHEDILKVFGRRAHQARPADIDLFDQFGKRHIRPCRGLDERIEIDAHEIDQSNRMLAGRMQILFVRSPRQNAAVDLWMQRLDTAIHHFWKAGNLRHVDDGHARIGERARGTAGGHEFEPAAHETACKRDEAALLETLRIALRM